MSTHIPALTCALLLAAGAAVALGQPKPGAPPATPSRAGEGPVATGVLSAMPLHEALDQAMARNRVLVVVVSPNRAREQANTLLWSHPALVNWAAWHAVVVHVADQATIRSLTDAGLTPGGPDQPLLFAEGLAVRLFGSPPARNTSRLRPAPRPAGPASYGPALRLMMRLEWSLRGQARVAPAWLAAHDAACPAPARPVLPAQALVSDAGAMDFREAAAQGLDGAAGADSLGRLIHALDLVKGLPAEGPPDADIARRAAGLFIGLWEQALSAEPSIGPSVLFQGSRAMHELGTRFPPAMLRFRALRDAQAAMLPWMNKRELFNWLMLCRVLGDATDGLDFLDASLDDPDAVGVMPPDERFALEAMLPRLAWGDPLNLPGTGRDPVRFLARLHERVGEEALQRIRGLYEPGRSRLVGFLGTQLIDEGCRVYAALLARGRDEEAQRAAALVADVFKDKPLGAWMVSTALARGQSREHQVEMLSGTDAASVRLRERVKAMLAPK